MADEATTRDRVRDTVRRFPGVHFRGVVGELGISTALARYHLQALVEAGDVREVAVGGFTRYFPRAEGAGPSPEERALLAVLRRERPLEIVLTLLQHGPLQHRDLLDLLGGSKATLSYHLDQLVEAGVVRKVARGPERGFHLVDEERVRTLLTRYEPLPESLSRVHDTWEDLFGGRRRRRR